MFHRAVARGASAICQTETLPPSRPRPMPAARDPMSITRLLLVRHGATTATEEGRFSGSSGAELSDEGRRQAARLGERLAPQSLTAIYTSSLSRAMDTARTVAGHCRLEPQVRQDLREIHHGHWE